MRKNIIGVIDIGKTNSKIDILDIENGNLLNTYKLENLTIEKGDYPSLDSDGLWQWICQHLQIINQDYQIKGMSVATHGATFVCLSKDGDLVFPVADYESSVYTEYDSDYNDLRADFSETFSPNLPNGLNIGRQLYWLSRKFPEKFSHVAYIIPYAQYWVYQLTGKIVSEVTSLGSHTDLYALKDHKLSSLVERLNWQSLFPDSVGAGQYVADIQVSLSHDLGIPSDIAVHNGMHDTNAAFVPYLGENMTVISTGTWVVIASINNHAITLNEQEDMQGLVSAKGQFIPVMRFMGGREWDVISGGGFPCGLDDFQYCINNDIYAIPSFADNGGPFDKQNGYIENQDIVQTDGHRTALATLYCAFMTYYCCQKLNLTEKIVLEGAFVNNPFYMQILQRLYPADCTIQYTTKATGISGGLFQLIYPDVATDPLEDLIPTEGFMDGALVQNHYQNWLKHLPNPLA